MPKRRNIILIASAIFILVLVAVIAILLGVFITQKHYETIVQTTIKLANGEENSLAATLNKMENVATFYTDGKNGSATMVYDYNKSVIGLKSTNEDYCLIIKMEPGKFPSPEDIINNMKKSQEASGETQQLHLYSTGSQVVDRTVLCQTINVLCQNVPIYWAQQRRDVGRAGVNVTLNIDFGSVKVTVIFSF
ncbi:pulmonary surfactant-associated protein C-like isoform X2 [Protopterus annectens]|uniref:Surfc1 n=2 Tax=Protopterus annectens TaxID=7888 RepID=A0A1P8W1P6_PROAN|nr:pulmonary surfactant-associated protein C-like isoform X2 [Protopterus annectens]XP_043917893.1 pulmonary surfactant-associated protein C-like isoform X2 [Protopterus annectens]APZ85623.1 surfc1 [Protopterus annectens]